MDQGQLQSGGQNARSFLGREKNRLAASTESVPCCNRFTASTMNASNQKRPIEVTKSQWERIAYVVGGILCFFVVSTLISLLRAPASMPDQANPNWIGSTGTKQSSQVVDLPQLDPADPAIGVELFTKLPPLDSSLSSEEKKKACLDIAEQHYLSTTTVEQRDSFCSRYATLTPKALDTAFKQNLIDMMDTFTPQERYDWCLKNREVFFAGETLGFAESACSDLRTDWPPMRKAMVDSLSEVQKLP